MGTRRTHLCLALRPLLLEALRKRCQEELRSAAHREPVAGGHLREGEGGARGATRSARLRVGLGGVVQCDPLCAVTWKYACKRMQVYVYAQGIFATVTAFRPENAPARPL